MNDEVFLRAFESASLHPFPHAAHIRMAWSYVRAQPWETALNSIRLGIQRLALAHGAARKYHETMTVFWARMVKQAVEAQPDIAVFDRFSEAFPQLFDSGLIKQFYSPGLKTRATYGLSQICYRCRDYPV